MVWISPDCRDGNHRKCDGQAWDVDADDVTGCGCPGCVCNVAPVDPPVDEEPDDSFDCHDCGAEAYESCTCDE